MILTSYLKSPQKVVQQRQQINQNDDEITVVSKQYSLFWCVMTIGLAAIILLSFFSLPIDRPNNQPAPSANYSINYQELSQHLDQLEKANKITTPMKKYSEIGNQSLKYIKGTQSDVYTFPPTPPMSAPAPIAFTEFNSIEEIEQFITNMETDNQLIRNKQFYSRLGYGLYMNQESRKHIEAEYYYMNKLYEIGKYEKQLPMCVFASGKNLYSKRLHQDFFISLSRQNYTNFRVILVDDASEDDTTRGIYAFVQKYTPNLKPKLTLIRNHRTIGAFANKDSGIKENCKMGDIVVDMDADDGLIGRQVFKVLNALYQKQNGKYWVVYSNHLNLSGGQVKPGLSKPLPQNLLVNYRRSRTFWCTSHLKTYRMALYAKIPLEYLTLPVLSENTIVDRKYAQYASDQYMMISMIQLAGSNQHIFFLPQLVYFYRTITEKDKNFVCHRSEQMNDELQARSMTKLLPLASLSDEVRQDPTQRWIYDIRGYYQIWKYNVNCKVREYLRN